MVPAVRSPTGSCVDEQGCDWEKVTLCAFDQVTPSSQAQVDFLVCMDESSASSATAAGKACATKVSGIDYSTIETCANGSKATTLLKAAADKFNAKLPGRTTIPHTFVNDADTSPSYGAIESALCKDGSTAAVCQQFAAQRKECIV